ncbi:MAG: lipid A-modifier LpxR family protein [Bacteroidales bacterium]|nr:lipid A-modifier LpxR family protein [Bacteroidales bacterium]
MKLFATILIIFLSSVLFAQKVKQQLIFELRVDNDMTFYTDQYYSNGIEFKVYAAFMNKSPLNFILLPNGKQSRVYYSLTFTHKIYTPIEIYVPQIKGIDHPYASYLLIGSQKESFNHRNRYKLSSAIQIGVMGPASGGGYFQNTLHHNISIADHVEGWDTQVGNDFCLQYSAMIEKGIVNVSWFELNAYVGGKLGIPHTEAQVGGYFRLGKFDDYFSHMGIDASTNWQLWFFVTGDLYFVNYNAAIQGGAYNQGVGRTIPYINSNIWHTRFGGTFVFKLIKLEIGQEVVSPSFPTALWHRWAYASLMIGF